MFSEAKATAMACYFLERAPNHRLNDLKLMKLLYMAERESLHRHTASMTDATFASLKNGPVLSPALDLFYQKGEAEFWPEHIGFLSYNKREASENTIYLRSRLNVEEHLSRAEIAILAEVWEKHKHKTKWDLVDLTHDFPEWDEDAAKYETALTISLKDIFVKGFNEDPDVAAGMVEDIDYYRSLDSIGAAA